MISESVDIIEHQKKLRILDIGCGNGSLSNLVAQQGYEVVGIEESESGVKLANDNFPNCRFIEGSIYNTALPAIMQYSFSPCPLLSKLSDLRMYLIAAESAVSLIQK
ncbi:class I SAM-dependent methyltransferase [uncultured Nostoc sp.]|uniref:class I SAM-dependent methyltransferase n=1 Tax=uncultured Nostoc sp. TaxID=340711 RepID=UPI0035CC83D3